MIESIIHIRHSHITLYRFLLFAGTSLFFEEELTTTDCYCYPRLEWGNFRKDLIHIVNVAPIKIHFIVLIFRSKIACYDKSEINITIRTAGVIFKNETRIAR